jgi:PleD family two-component response regulator
VVKDPNDLLLAFERSRGLGLAICRDFVERHGGEIWAEAPPEGGALFAFTLPIKLEGERRSPESVRTDAPLVLLAEDDPVLLRVASMGLSGHYRVETARDGDEVLRRTKALRPDVIVMDAFMPTKDGLEALRELKAAPETRAIPVVLIAGSAEIAEKLRALELGAVDTLTKPFALSALLTRVSTALQRSRARPALPQGPGNDPETGLFDHLGILNRIQQEISRSVRYGRPLTLAALRPATPPGPQMQACVAVVRRELRSPDVVGHLGGGVLVLVLPETPHDSAGPLVARLCALLEAERVTYRSRLVDVRESAAEGEAEHLLERLLS